MEMTAELEMAYSYKVFRWARVLLLSQGVWPAQPNDLIFFANFAIFAYQMITHYFDLATTKNDVDQVFENIHEHMAFMPLFIRLIALRLKIGSLGVLFSEAEKHYRAEDYTYEERRTFVAMHSRGEKLAKLLVGTCTVTLIAYYLRPFLLQISDSYALSGDHRNVTFQFILPYRYCSCYYEMKNVPTYFGFYAAQVLIAASLACTQGSGDCAMVALVFHLCARMSVLILRVTKVDTSPERCTDELRKIIKIHIELLRIGKILENSFSFALLGYVGCITILVCVIGFELIAKLKGGDVFVLVSLASHFTLVVFVLLGYCYAGQSLLTESENLSKAFYNCNWFDMPPGKSKLVFFCIMRSSQPLQLNGGKFVVLCYTTFSSSLKAALGYLSVLRTVLQ